MRVSGQEGEEDEEGEEETEEEEETHAKLHTFSLDFN